MHNLVFVVNKQNIEKREGFDGLVAGTKGYLQARFVFSSDWAGYRKVALFTCRNGEYPVLLSNTGTCPVPDEAAACSSFKVRIIGRRTDDTVTSGRVTVIQRRH